MDAASQGAALVYPERTWMIHDARELPLLLTVSELAQVLGVGRTRAYEQIREPGFPAIRIGKQIRIPRDALLRWFESRAESPAQGREVRWR